MMLTDGLITHRAVAVALAGRSVGHRMTPDGALLFVSHRGEQKLPFTPETDVTSSSFWHPASGSAKCVDPGGAGGVGMGAGGEGGAGGRGLPPVTCNT